MGAFLADAIEQHGCGLFRRILWHELALDGHLQHGFAQALGQRSVQRFALVLQLAVLPNERHQLGDALGDAALLGEGRHGNESGIKVFIVNGGICDTF